jgi:arsenate reductase
MKAKVLFICAHNSVCDQAREVCPFFPGGRIRLHQSFEDPSQSEGMEEEKLAGFRKVRDKIKDWVKETFRPTRLSDRRLGD